MEKLDGDLSRLPAADESSGRDDDDDDGDDADIGGSDEMGLDDNWLEETVKGARADTGALYKGELLDT